MSRKLAEIAAAVESFLAGLDGLPADTRGDYRTRHNMADGFIGELRVKDGARPGRKADAYELEIAGVSSSCTSGYPGLLRNWLAAARRRIASEAQP